MRRPDPPVGHTIGPRHGIRRSGTARIQVDGAGDQPGTNRFHATHVDM